MSVPTLRAIMTLAARSALRGRLPDGNFRLDIPPLLSDFLGHREDLGFKLVGERDCDPLAAGQDDHTMRWPATEFLFNQQTIGGDL